MTKERITGVIIMLLGILITIGTYQMKVAMMLAQGDPGPKLFLYIASIGLMVCGAGMAAFPKYDKKSLTVTKEELLRFAFLFLILALYCMGLRYIGFLISTLFALLALVYILKMDKKVSMPFTVIFAVVLTILLYLLFKNCLSIVLPEGMILEKIR